MENDKKLAIDVYDDQEFNSEQSYAIHLKNSRLIEIGWDVIRFMPYQLKDDLDWCLKQILYKVNRKQI
jgi:very-short-patch-repair endonuclease